MKAILVIDMPVCCYDCDLWDDGTKSFYCKATGKFYEDNSIRQDWCPLKPMPNRDPISEEMMDDETRDFGCAFNTGWNNCLDEIGEEDEDTI